MGKYLCEWKGKEIEKHLGEIERLVKKPEYVCRKCARCSNSKKALCKPIKLFE